MEVDIIAIGEPMLEFNASEEGSLSEVAQFTVGWGGDTSNFSIAAARLGQNVGYLTRLGEDEFGESFLNLWKREGIDTSQVVKDPNGFTGIYFISRKGKEHFFTYFRKGSAASLMTPEIVTEVYIRQARLLHISGISQGISRSACDTIFEAVGIARAAGITISYDPNFRPKLWPIQRARAVIHETIRQADLVFPSLEDARSLSGLSDPEEIAGFYLNMGPKAVVLKLGGEGALLAIPEGGEKGAGAKCKIFPPFQVESVDMSGAGDTFDAAFVTGYLNDWSLEECMRFANAAAALTTTGFGCVTPVPRREQVEVLLRQQTV